MTHDSSIKRTKWWRKGYQAAVDRLVAGLRWRFKLDDLDLRLAAAEERIGRLEPVAATWTVTRWVAQATLEKTPLVSVILPTHNRSRLLRRAVESVVAQRYSNWELVVIDDGSGDDTPAVVDRLREKLGEQKLRAIRISSGGVCAARNHGLRAAKGEYIAYLDDDNMMAPLWLKAVVWAFSQRPDMDVLYGGMIIDDLLRVNRQSRGALPSYHLKPFTRENIVNDNLADIGAMAHRAGMAEAYFDEQLREMGDWDLLVRLTRNKPPLVLPVLACFYSTDEADRLSCGPTFDCDMARVRQKAKS